MGMPMLVSKSLRLIAGLGAAALAALAQAQSQPANPQQPPFVVRTTTQLVQVNAIAVDSQNNPVPNLTVGDFKLTDNGKPQTISVFSMEKNEATASSSAPPQTRGSFSNHVEQASRNVIVILIDDSNQDTLGDPSLSLRIGEDLAYAKQEIRKFFQQMRPQDYVALYAMHDQLRVLHDFTTDPVALIHALDHYVPPPLLPAVLPVVGDQFPNESQQDYNVLARLKGSVAMFQAITEHLAAVPGRKSLVWVTAGFPTGLLLPFQAGGSINPSGLALDPNTVWPGLVRPLVEKAARAFNSASLAIYPVDVRGLLPPSAYTAGHPAQATTLAQQARPDVETVGLPQGEDEIATMRDIADRTGGRAFYHTNDFTGAIRQAADDGRVTYTLGYYPSETKWDGTFHTIALKVTRPGVSVRYRRGYFALPPEQLDATGRQKALMAAALSPLDAASVQLTVRARRHGPQDSPEAELELAIDPRSVSFENSNGVWNAEIELAVVELNAQGDTLKAYDQIRTMTLKPETHDRVEKEGIRFPLSFRILPETERIRIVVRDNFTGALGSLNLPLSQVPSS